MKKVIIITFCLLIYNNHFSQIKKKKLNHKVENTEETRETGEKIKALSFEIKNLQDSLEKLDKKYLKRNEFITAEIKATKINSSYFSTALGLYTTIVSIIVAIAIFIAGFLIPKKQMDTLNEKIDIADENLKERINSNKEDFQRDIDKTDEKITKLKQSLDEIFSRKIEESKIEVSKNYEFALANLKKIKKQLESTELQVRKSMFFQCNDNKNYLGEALWAIRTVDYYVETCIFKEEKENIKSFLNFTLNPIKDNLKKEQLTKEYIDEFKEILEFIKDKIDEELTEIVIEIEKEMYKKYYS